MRQGDGASYAIWEGVDIGDLASQVDAIAHDPQSCASVSPTAAHSNGAPATTTQKTAVLAWLAGRLCWEHRLDGLRATKAAELEGGATQTLTSSAGKLTVRSTS